MSDDHFAQLKEVAMTATERTLLRQRLHAYALLHAPVRSLPLRVWSWTLRHGAFVVGLAVVLSAAGTGVSASLAHPGDTLYEFRLSVNDRIETALAFSDDAQIDVEMQQMQRMIDDEDATVSTQLESLRDGAETDAVDAAEDDFESELDALERELMDEQYKSDDMNEDADKERELQDGTESVHTNEEFQFEQELKNIGRELQDEEDRSERELE
jgi:hypothetical protein